ncbi:MAG: hypothetical protein COT37_02045 [Parcubacteria group bacterium CG08_land_8_20_14_0_20_43_9]|nr:MAG: hypothetical protein COT37_02045 [Parcubacteria group bacterium CG08_land_8_20_14_0_20_43_9]
MTVPPVENVAPTGIVVRTAPGVIGGVKAVAGGTVVTGDGGRDEVGIGQSMSKNPSSHHVLNCGSTQLVFRFMAWRSNPTKKKAP